MINRKANGTDLPLIPLGTEIRIYGRVAAVGVIEGERYYWIVDGSQCVSMMPATTMNALLKEGE